jgi:biopolymer transport protein ExbD
VYVLIIPVHVSKGFEAGIASARCDSDESDRLVVLHISDSGRVFLNLEQQKNWSTLQSRLSEIYSMRVYRVLYLSAEPGVPFQTAADAIDTVTSTPENITVHLVTPGALETGCPARLAGSSTAHPSK